MLQFTPYILTSLLSAVVILAMGICLFTVSMPRERELKAYRISRRLLGTAYILLAFIHFAGIFLDFNIHADMIVALFQALLFTFALISLINSRFVTRRKLLLQISLAGIIAVLILINIYVLEEYSLILDIVIDTGYFSLYIYYVWLFFREYRNYKRRADNFYSGNDHRRLQWVVEVFVMVAVVGIFAGILTENNIYFLVFIIIYTFFYIYLAIRYINYVNLFHRMAPIVVIPKNEDYRKEPGNGKDGDVLAQWIERKGFLHTEITLDTLADELYTTPSWLSRHINSRYGQNFRSWIASMRISESMRLIEDRPDLTMDEIQERSGIPSNSSFFRQFRSVTGITPAEYRRKVNNCGATKE